MKIESFRVENKDNIWFDGRKTIFTLYESKNGVWFRISNFMAEGYDASDEQCIEAGLVTLATLDTLSKAKEPKGKLESGLSKSEIIRSHDAAKADYKTACDVAQDTCKNAVNAAIGVYDDTVYDVSWDIVAITNALTARQAAIKEAWAVREKDIEEALFVRDEIIAKAGTVFESTIKNLKQPMMQSNPQMKNETANDWAKPSCEVPEKDFYSKVGAVLDDFDAACNAAEEAYDAAVSVSDTVVGCYNAKVARSAAYKVIRANLQRAIIAAYIAHTTVIGATKAANGELK